MAKKDVKGGKPTLNPTALTIPELARMLSLDVAVIKRHIDEGAPILADGHINLVYYAAWLNRRL